MNTTKVVIKPGDKISPELLSEINRASDRSIKNDDDSPKFSKAEMRLMAERAKRKRAAEKKPVVALRVSPKTLELAKATGKGYTGFMSRLLDLAINDLDMVNKALEG